MTKAAEILAISQPAVSRLIVDFEQAVGLRLFNRQRGGAEPTEDGRMLLGQVERLFVDLEELNHHVAAIKSLSTCTLTIVAVDIYANGILPEIIAAFRALHPQVGIRLESQPQDRIVDWVASHRCDLGFATLPLANTAVPALKLIERPALCVMPVDHPLAASTRVRASDLAGRPFVSFLRGAPFRYETDALFEKASIDRILLTEAMTHEAVIPVTMGVLGDVSVLSSAALAFFTFAIDELSRRAPTISADGSDTLRRPAPLHRKEARS